MRSGGLRGTEAGVWSAAVEVPFAPNRRSRRKWLTRTHRLDLQSHLNEAHRGGILAGTRGELTVVGFMQGYHDGDELLRGSVIETHAEWTVLAPHRGRGLHLDLPIVQV